MAESKRMPEINCLFCFNIVQWTPEQFGECDRRISDAHFIIA